MKTPFLVPSHLLWQAKWTKIKTKLINWDEWYRWIWISVFPYSSVWCLSASICLFKKWCNLTWTLLAAPSNWTQDVFNIMEYDKSDAGCHLRFSSNLRQLSYRHIFSLPSQNAHPSIIFSVWRVCGVHTQLCYDSTRQTVVIADWTYIMLFCFSDSQSAFHWFIIVVFLMKKLSRICRHHLQVQIRWFLTISVLRQDECIGQCKKNQSSATTQRSQNTLVPCASVSLWMNSSNLIRPCSLWWDPLAEQGPWRRVVGSHYYSSIPSWWHKPWQERKYQMKSTK